jgi:hypothetical protein
MTESNDPIAITDRLTQIVWSEAAGIAFIPQNSSKLFFFTLTFFPQDLCQISAFLYLTVVMNLFARNNARKNSLRYFIRNDRCWKKRSPRHTRGGFVEHRMYRTLRRTLKRRVINGTWR